MIFIFCFIFFVCVVLSACTIYCGVLFIVIIVQELYRNSLSATSGYPGNTGNALEFEIPSGNTAYLLKFKHSKSPPGN